MENDIDKHIAKLTDIYKLRLGGMTYQEIANRMGISRQRVHQILTGYKGVKKRNLSYTQKLSLKYKESAARRRLQMKEQVLSHYGNGKLACVWCGFDDIWALCLEHIASKGHKDKHSGSLYRKLIEEGFPPGYQTICMNCRYIRLHMRHETGGKFKKRRKYVRHKKIL